MATALDLLKKLEAFDLEETIEKCFELTEDDIADTQREQMLHGENSQGEDIGYYRNSAYAELKERLNPLAGGTVDLKITGDFHKGIYATVIGEELVISSFDEKTDDLEQKYGDEIFGINDNYRTDYIDQELRPAFEQAVERELGLKFQ